MDLHNILVSTQNHIATLTINRPKKLNALNSQTISELHFALDTLNKDSEIGCVVITGKGDKSFVAGADIVEFSDFNAKEGKELASKGQELLFNFVENMNKPVIAAINGYALGGGLELAMACHIRIASENAKMGLPESSLGLIPGYGGTQRLPLLIGKGRANQMMFTASLISAEKASLWGLVNSVYPQDELISKAYELALQILQNSPMALTALIQSVNASQEVGVNGFEKEIDLFGECFDTEDFIKGTQAFLNKNKPNYWGS